MVKKAENILINIVRVLDYLIFVLVVPFCVAGLVFAIPWILKQRKIWNRSAKGSPKVLILRGFTLGKVQKKGFDHLLPYRNPYIKWIGFLDPSNDQKTEIKVADGLNIITFKSLRIIEFFEKKKIYVTSVIFRELIAIFRITNYCVKEQIGILRVYKHDYPALQAYLVSSFIKIPFIVDIIGNFELIRRLTGKVYYFRKLNSLPFIRIFARPATNWLLGLPLRHATRVLGRDKCTYEHAFSLGTPVEKLSLLRISNFNTAFNAYNPEQPPDKPVNYPYFLFVGRLVEIKYPLDAIAAFDLVAAHLPEYRLVIIGDGGFRNVVKRKKEHSKYKDRIILLGACSSHTVLNWTAHAKAAICPFSGSTLVEAVLCGLPVVAYDVAGHPEIVIDDYTGFLVPFANVEALAEKLIYVVRNYGEARIAAMRGRELARVTFDKEKIAEKESMIYRQVLQIPESEQYL